MARARLHEGERDAADAKEARAVAEAQCAELQHELSVLRTVSAQAAAEATAAVQAVTASGNAQVEDLSAQLSQTRHELERVREEADAERAAMSAAAAAVRESFEASAAADRDALTRTTYGERSSKLVISALETEVRGLLCAASPFLPSKWSQRCVPTRPRAGVGYHHIIG